MLFRSDRIERRLGIGRPTILCEYPIGMAALARAKPGDPRVAERFELYACGVELANAFGELTDPRVQQQQPTAEQLTMLGRIRRVLGAAGGPRLAAVSTGS